MSIKIKLAKEFLLDDLWCNKRDFDEVFKDDREAFLELLNEDWLEVYESAGGLNGLLKEYQWVRK